MFTQSGCKKGLCVFRLLIRCRRGVLLLGMFSIIVAMLQFVVPLYMMAIYNRILQTGSLETLRLISIIAALLLLGLGIAEIARSRVLAIMSRRIGDYLNGDVYRAVLASPSDILTKTLAQANASTGDSVQQFATARTQYLSDLRQVTAFVSSGALNTFFDAVLAPVFFCALFLLHPLLGWLGLGAGALILGLAMLTEVLARSANTKISQAEGRAQSKIERSIGQFDAVASMGFAQNLFAKWQLDRHEAMRLTLQSQSIIGLISGLARAIRLMVQIAILGLGAWLALTTDVFLAGAIIAASLILGRALAPIDQSISIWRRFVQARAGAKRLMQIVDIMDTTPQLIDLPPPKAELSLSSVTLAFPGQRSPMLQGASLSVAGGEVLGICGPNGSGKTTLLRALCGLHTPRNGTVALGTTPMDAMTEANRQRDIGFLPQDIQLLPGTIQQNISRYQQAETVGNAAIEAAHRVGAAGFIGALEEGFGAQYHVDTLSAGQIQLLGLARAIYKDPLLVLLDEPTANLDAQNKAMVAELIAARRDAGTITIFISHDHDLLSRADRLLFLASGAAKLGAADEVLRYLSHQHQLSAQAISGQQTGGARYDQ